MKRTKKGIALLLVFILILSSLSLTGCGTNSNKKKGEPITLQVYSQRANYSGMQIGWFAKVLLDKFNVKFNMINEVDGTFTTRMESGNLGDIIIFDNDNKSYLDAVNKKMLYDWNEEDLLSEEGPDIKANLGKAMEKNISINPDGKLYGLGMDAASSPDDHGSTIYHPDVRYDLYKQLGYPKVETLESWIDILAQMKEICPKSDTGEETFGVSFFPDWDDNMVMFVKATGGLYGVEEMGIGHYDPSTQTWEDCLSDGSKYLRFLAFYNKLYQKGLLDPDSMTQTATASGEDYTSGSAFFTLFNYAGSIQYNTPEHLEAGKAMYPVMMEDQKPLMFGLNVYGANSVITIGAQTQYPELCMQIINWLSTPEGKMISNYGPKGVTWDYDENKKTYLTELGLKTISDGKTPMEGEYSDCGMFKDGVNTMNFSTWNFDSVNPDSAGESYNYFTWPSYNATLTSDILQDWRKFTGFTTMDEYLDSREHAIMVGTSYSETKRNEDLELKWQRVSKAIRDYSWQAIYAANDDEYAALVKEMKEVTKDYGYDEVADFYRNEALRRKASEDEVRSK